MSVFHMTPMQVNETVRNLPATHTKEQVVAMIEALQQDVQRTDPSLSHAQKVQMLANQHKELFFSYPMLFRSVCKGTYRPVVLDILWKAREAMESGEKTKKEALDDVIRESVDEVNEYRRKHPLP